MQESVFDHAPFPVIPVYQLMIDENETLKIQKILFWEEVLPPGGVDFGEIFMRDPEMRKGFSP